MIAVYNFVRGEGIDMKRDLPIAVFDSGLGGMSLLAELIRVLPNESFLYFGDTANAPYGTRNEDDVKRLTEQNLEYLLSLGIKAFVIACNTATSAAAAYLREKHKDLIIIGIEPALKPVTLCEGSPTVAVLATPLTLKGEKFAALLAKHSGDARVIPFPCPGLVEFVERGVLEGEELDAFLSELLAPLKDEDIDCAVLGCTHYPLVKGAIIKALGKDVRLFDGGLGTARQTARRLEESGLLSDSAERGRIDIIDSSYPDRINPEGSFLVKFFKEYICN